MTASPLADWRDVQGLVVSGYGRLIYARYSVWSIVDPALAKTWLRTLAPKVTHAHAPPYPTEVMQVAFSYSGLTKLTGGASQFPPEFVEGMAGDSHRSRVLGDVDESAPNRWWWGGPDRPSVDVVLLHFSGDPIAPGAHPGSPAANGLLLVASFDSVRRDDREPFGFADGLSQPILEGTHKAARAPSSRHLVRLGEMLLGYRDNAGEIAPLPAIPGHADFGMNGTFLVARQLEQDVAGFKTFIDTQAAAHGMCPKALAEKFVGRTTEGVVLTPGGVQAPTRHDNEFGFAEHDPFGEGCPLGAHIRRGNPRDTLQASADDSWRTVNRHRVMRRGRPYRVNDVPAGLIFVGLVGDIARQFEFVQQNWINDAGFAGLNGERDPLVGCHPARRDTFTIPEYPLRRRITGGLGFITTRGGEYFFLPAIHALHQLAS